MKLYKIYCSLSFAATLCLTGCGPSDPMMFGMPASQFHSLTQQQQDQVISAYNQRQQTKEQNAPYQALIHSVAPAIHAAKEKPYQSNNDMPAPTAPQIQEPQMPQMQMPPMPKMPNM